MAASELYNTLLKCRLQKLGLQFAPARGWDRSKRPFFEIVGVPQELLDHWSVRRRDITRMLKDLSRQFGEDHGRPPTPVEKIGLAQHATLETRDPKHSPQSEAEQRERWSREAFDLLGEHGFDGMQRDTVVHPALKPPVMGDA